MSARIVVLISGQGSNLQSIINAVNDGKINGTLSAVISNKADVFGLERARMANIPAHTVDHRQFDGRPAFEQALRDAIDPYQPDIIVLAGFMRILTEDFVNTYLGKMLNIHPSLLPKYAGLNTHQRALEAGDSEHGTSIHFVTPELDGGPVISQGIIAIGPDDSVADISQRVLMVEHALYPETIGWLADGRLHLRDNHAWFDGEPLPTTGIQKDYRDTG